MTAIKDKTGTLRGVLDALRRSAWPLILTGIFYRLIALTLLTPLVSWLASFLIALSGQGTIVNERIASFFLEPLGFFTLVVLAAVSLTLVALEQACLMVITFEPARTGFIRSINALKFVFSRSHVILNLAGRIVLRVLLLSIPFLALAGLAYFLMLTGHDINYYLALQPPAFKWAIGIVGLTGLAFAIALTRLAAGLILSLPILLFESKSPVSSLRESRLRTRGHRKRFAVGVFVWGLAVLSLSGITATLFVWLARLVAPALVNQTALLVMFFGGLFLSTTLVQLLVSMAAAASFSLLIVEWYRPLSPALPDFSIKPLTGIKINPNRTRHLSGRMLIAGTILATVVAMATGWLILSRVDLKDRTEIMAHRGASAAAPENTMAAIERAIAEGAHWVEIDVQRTADDQVVVIHDRDLMKVGGEPLVVSESLLGDITKVDVGSWFKPEFASQRIPTLDQVLKHCKEAIKVNIELKYYGWDERLAHRVIEIVEKVGMETDIVVMSLQPAAVRQVKNMRPGWQVGLLSAASLSDLAREKADFLAVHSRMATRGFIRRAHNVGKSLYVWTVNDAIGMMQMFDLGIDALITDKPGLAAHLLRQREKLDPAERMLLAAGLLSMGEPEHIDPATDGL